MENFLETNQKYMSARRIFNMMWIMMYFKNFEIDKISIDLRFFQAFLWSDFSNKCYYAINESKEIGSVISLECVFDKGI